MHSQELELLIREYSNAATNEDKLIKRKLEFIASLCADCKSDEFIFANEITDEFCRLIRLLKEQHKREPESSVPSAIHPSGFSPYHNEKTVQYECGHHLLGSFYNHFKKPHEISYYEMDAYPFANEAEKKERINSTLLDYVARIYTFANKYLREIFSAEVIAASNAPDDVIFVYNNLEIILARFHTKDENGVSIKQRVNIRSALRKLNEFKQIEAVDL